MTEIYIWADPYAKNWYTIGVKNGEVFCPWFTGMDDGLMECGIIDGYADLPKMGEPPKRFYLATARVEP